jgi:mono/diheme cytochrome c family protein
MKLRRVAAPVLAIIVLAMAGCFSVTPAAPPAPASKASAAEIARGKYLGQAADCAACHTAAGGAPYAGGLPMQSGFGTIYATNITPDSEYGIGHWTADDLWRALHDGVARGGRHLYPAMPYTSYRGMARADSDAIYAYLMQLRPMHVPNRRTRLRFPYNIRFGMVAWNALFLRGPIPAASQGSTATWQRGRYLIDVLGHCGECHTPRGWLGQMKLAHRLSGSALGRFSAPDITPAGLVSRGWTALGLAAFLGSGLAPQGSAFSEMHPVIAVSTRHLTAEDLKAAVTYLLGDHPPVPPPAAMPAAAANLPGRVPYLSLCAGCHGLDGNGKPHTVVAMRRNSVLRLDNPHNLILTMLDGIGAQDFPDLESMQAMPGFADKLSDQQAADLANYLRAAWGARTPDVTAATVNALR